jgi:hypothetical protein
MADINVILQDLKGTIADLTVDNAILRAEIAERDARIRQLESEKSEEEKDVRSPELYPHDSDVRSD